MVVAGGGDHGPIRARGGPSGSPPGRGGEPNACGGGGTLTVFVCPTYNQRRARRPRNTPSARHARGRPPDAARAARRGRAALRRARRRRRLGRRDRPRGGRLPEPGDVLLRQQGGALRRGRLPGDAARRRPRSSARVAATRSPRGYVRACVHTALASPALLNFVEAATLVRHRPDLAPRVRETFARLHLEGERAVADSLVARGWQIRAAPATEARGFWAVGPRHRPRTRRRRGGVRRGHRRRHGPARPQPLRRAATSRREGQSR